MAKPTARERKQAILTARLNELRAILVLTRRYNVEQRAEFEQLQETLERGTNRQLDILEVFLTEQLSLVSAQFRPTQPPAFYARYVEGALIEEGHFLYVPKWHLKAFFAAFEQSLPTYALLPEHAQLSIDVRGDLPAMHPGEIRILEAALFEDMASLFNRAFDLTPLAMNRETPKPALKECASSRRAAVLSAFYVIEAYLNSIAFDLLVQRPPADGSPEMDIITEWNHSTNREKRVGFRDKLLQYPRIILGLDHPPLQESNCPELAYILTVAKQFRDSVVHASPRPSGPSPFSEKELTFWRLGSATPIRFSPLGQRSDPEQEPSAILLGTVDNTIALLRRIERTIRGNTNRLFWVHDRDSSGRFADSVFE